MLDPDRSDCPEEIDKRSLDTKKTPDPDPESYCGNAVFT